MLARGRSTQVLGQERKSTVAVDAVGALKKLNLGPVGQPKLRVKELNLAVLVRHPLIAAT